MRRKSDSDVKKENAIFLVMGLAFILLGLFILFSPLMTLTPYEEHVEKEVVITKFGRFRHVKGSSYDYIVTEDGEEYNLTGEYKRSELTEILLPGTPATIKYTKNKLLPWKNFAEEIIVNDQKVVTYDNDQPPNWAALILVSSLLFLLGTASVFFYRYNIIHNQKQQKKRDARIMKKYGKLKK